MENRTMEVETPLSIFELILEEDNTLGVFGISLVQEPANATKMFHFSSEEQIWKMANEEKHIIVSPVLIPNQKIYRGNANNEGERGYVFASESTIEKLQQNFFKQGYNFNSNINHGKEPIDDVYFFESWLIEDPLNDKANSLGFKDLPKGTWMVSMKIENEEVWDKYVKTGLVTGLSIEGLLKPKKIETQKINEVKMEQETINEIVRLAVEQIKTDMACVKPVKMAVELVINETTTYYVDSLEVGSLVTDSNGQPVLSTEFEYDGKEYVTDEQGALKEVVTEVEPTEDVVAEPMEDVVEAVEEPMVEDPKDLKIAELEAKIKELEGQNIKLSSDIVFNESELVKLKSETPSSNGISNMPKEVKDFSKMTELEKYRLQKQTI